MEAPLFVLRVDIPELGSFGFEKDLRVHIAGQAFGTMWLDHWEIAPGDPLGCTTKLKLLEPSASPKVARDIMIKTQRGKGTLINILYRNVDEKGKMMNEAMNKLIVYS